MYTKDQPVKIDGIRVFTVLWGKDYLKMKFINVSGCRLKI